MSEKTVFEVVEAKIRNRNQITIPPGVCSFLRCGPDDFIRFELHGSVLVICKSVTHRVGGNGGRFE